MKHAISVIVPTTASMQRVPLLWRALRSLQPDRDQTVIPIVVVNGDRYVPAALETLQRRRDIRCLYLEHGNHTDARRAGRGAVETEFFGMLDDDDEYLPGTTGLRLDPLVSDPSVDVVITNGYEHQNGEDVIQFPGLSDFGRDPLGVLMDHPWLHTAGVTFRSEAIPARYLDGPRSMELTYMALKLALTKKLYFLGVPTYRWYRGTAESLWETEEYQRGAPDAIRQMLTLNPPARIKRRLARKYAASLHSLSELERRKGDYLAAWRYHARSLVSRYGIRYLSYTRHLLRLRHSLRDRKP